MALGRPPGSGRRPDGVVGTPDANGFVDGGNEASALETPATTPQEINAALNPGESFPAGLKCIAHLPDDAIVTVCNLTLKTYYYDDFPSPRQKEIKREIKRFTTAEMKAGTARRIMAKQERPSVKRPSRVLVIVGMFPGDCQGKRTFKAHGRTFRSCPYSNCPYGDHAQHPWSLWMAQHFIRTLKTPESMTRFGQHFDLRSDVAALINSESQARREAHKREQMQAGEHAAASEAVF
jgi:hypothetical protein